MLRKFFRHNYQLVWHSKFQSACINLPQHFNNDELLPFIDNSDNHHPQYYNLLDFPPSHFAYITYDSTSIDKSLNIPPPIRPYAKQHHLPPSIDTSSNIFLQTFPSSSNVILNTNPTTNPFFPPSTPQTTTTTANLSASHTPNQYSTPSNTPPVIPSISAQLPVYQIPTIPPIPLSLNNTLSTQALTQTLPIYFSPENFFNLSKPSIILTYTAILLIHNLLPLTFSLHHIIPMSHFTLDFKIFLPILFNLLIFLLILFHHLILHYPLIILLLTTLHIFQ